LTLDELREAGERLYGPAWAAPLAAALRLPRDTVRRWAEGRLPVGPDKAREVGRLLDAAGRHPVGRSSLAHLTMNTGDLVRSSRDQALPRATEWLARAAAAGRGEAAGIPFVIDRRGEATALFHIGEPSAVVCGVCWREDRAPAAWGALLAVVDIQSIRMAPVRRPPVPWLVVVLMPALAVLPPERLIQLGEMERCLAWCLIEAGE